MRRSTFILVMSLLFGCATVDSLQPGGGEKIVVRGHTYAEVWKAANRAMSHQLTIVSANRTTGAIRAEKAVGMATWGEVVGVFISPPDEKGTVFTVEAVSLKRSRLQLTGQDWALTVLQGIQVELE